MLKSILLIALGASFGAVSRWLVSSAFNPITQAIPLGTLMVNVGGSFLIGILSSLFLLFPHIQEPLKLVFITGFLGSFTTFSTFAAEVGLFIQHKDYLHTFLCIIAHLSLSLIAFFLGLFLFNKVLTLVGPR